MAITPKIIASNNTRKILMGQDLIISMDVNHKSQTVPVGKKHQLNYIWSRDGVPFGHHEGDLPYHGKQRTRSYYDRPVMRFHGMRLEDAGIYECTVSNHFGEVSSTAIVVEVFDVGESSMLAKNLDVNGDMR